MSNEQPMIYRHHLDHMAESITKEMEEFLCNMMHCTSVHKDTLATIQGRVEAALSKYWMGKLAYTYNTADVQCAGYDVELELTEEEALEVLRYVRQKADPPNMEQIFRDAIELLEVGRSLENAGAG